MSKKTTTKPVHYTLFFQGDDLVCKLAKRVDPKRYAAAQTLVERVFGDVFGLAFEHKSGTPQCIGPKATSAQADRISAALSLYEEIIELTYKRKPGSAVHETAIKSLQNDIEHLEKLIQSETEAAVMFEDKAKRARDKVNACRQDISALQESIRSLS